MTIDFIDLWHALGELPLIFSIMIYALVLFTTVVFVIIPVVLMVRSWLQELLRDILKARPAAAAATGWREAMSLVSTSLSLFNTAVGRLAAWLVLFMTLMQFVVVIMRYVYSYGSIQMQESIWYMYGTMFMLGAAYTLAKDGHVRLDVFYRQMSEHKKAWINLVGSVLLLLPFCIMNFDFAWPLVVNSWAVREGSTEAAGLPYLYLFKSVILVFCVLLAMEGVSLMLKSLLTLSDGVKIDSEHEAK